MTDKKSSRIQLTIYGEPASKSNQRRLVRLKNGNPFFIKSKKALDYSKAFDEQCKPLKELYDCDLCLEMMIYYSSRRPDLDESLILDLLQGKIYKNDRQVKIKKIYWGLDKDNPRTLIKFYPMKEEMIPKEFITII
tara:strand:- start:4119 stop:4526 length:408 start_codon:yes stop_codon:yes gene_type:complete